MNIPEGKSLILFDGVCNLCDKWVHRIIKYDHGNAFVFASLQSKMGETFCLKHGLDGNSTIVLINEDGFSVQSKAAFEILKRLKGPWRAMLILKILPRSITDVGYDLISSNRHRLHGKKDHCLVPTEEFRNRFLDL